MTAKSRGGGGVQFKLIPLLSDVAAIRPLRLSTEQSFVVSLFIKCKIKSKKQDGKHGERKIVNRNTDERMSCSNRTQHMWEMEVQALILNSRGCC